MKQVKKVGEGIILLIDIRSLAKYANEGFENAHKLQRLLYSLCTSHDGGKGSQIGSSILQIFQHFYATFMLQIR